MSSRYDCPAEAFVERRNQAQKRRGSSKHRGFEGMEEINEETRRGIIEVRKRDTIKNTELHKNKS